MLLYKQNRQQSDQWGCKIRGCRIDYGVRNDNTLEVTKKFHSKFLMFINTCSKGIKYCHKELAVDFAVLSSEQMSCSKKP